MKGRKNNRRFYNSAFLAHARRAGRQCCAIDALESRRLLAAAPVDPASAIPFQHIVIDPNPGPTPVIKVLADLNGDGKQDAVIAHESLGGNPRIDWYQFPTSGNPNDVWTKHTLATGGNPYESIVPYDVNGDGAIDLIVSNNGQIVWYQNPMGSGGDVNGLWTSHLIGSATGHEMYLADLDGDGKPDVVTNDAIFFQNSPTSWTTVAAPNFNRTQKGLALLDSGSGLGAVDLAGTGESPYNITWWENPRDHGGNARTDLWIAHVIGPGYDSVDSGMGVSYGTMDVNGDGRVDVITAEGETNGTAPRPPGGMIWWEAPADRRNGAWIAHTIDAGLQDVHNLRIGDVNGDGQSDIVFAEQDQSDQKRIGILFNVGGTGKNWQMQVLAAEGGQNQWMGDDLGNGNLDILSSPHGVFSGFNPIDLFQNGLAQSGITHPTINSQPSPQSVASGGAATFSIGATANAKIAYQWLRNGAAIPGATSWQYSLNGVATADNGAVIQCVVSDAAGFVNSAPATLSVTSPATPQAWLSATTLSNGGSATYPFSVTYTDSAALLSSTLGDGNLIVTGPGGYSQPAILLSTGLGNSQPLTALYAVPAPTSSWTSAANGVYTVSVQTSQVRDAGGQFVPSGNIGTFTVNIPAAMGMINGAASVSTPTSAYNLSNLGGSDWAHWGRGGTYGNFDHKSSGGSQISNVSIAGTGAAVGGYTDASRSVSWTGGSPTPSVSGDHGYIWENGALNTGYSFSVPADATPRTLLVYAGGFGTASTISATLSDGSAPAYSASDSGAGIYNDIYTITYRAASAGQHLTITILKTRNISGTTGSVDLVAAALSLVPATLSPPFSATPGAAGLTPASDSGASSSDGLTDLNNASAGKALQFTIPGTITGATVTLYADGVPIGSATASGSTTIVSTDGTTLLADGIHDFTARQAVPGDLQSAASSASGVTVDTIAPAAYCIPADVTAPGTTAYSFSVIYVDSQAVDFATLGNQNILVSGPGFTAPATLVSTSPAGSAGTITATYQFAPPGGAWSAAANGVYTLSLQANQVADTAGNFILAQSLNTFTVDIVQASGGRLSGTDAPASTSTVYNLTAMGNLDWAHWGRNGTYGSFDHKATANPLISDVIVVGAGANVGGWSDAARSVSWTNGSPTPSVAGDHGYIWSNGQVNSGYAFNVPADTATRVLVVYAGGNGAGTSLRAHLSDGSAHDYTVTGASAGVFSRIYTITYRAATANQTLTLTFLKALNISGTTGSADLVAATLALPSLRLGSPIFVKPITPIYSPVIISPQPQSLTASPLLITSQGSSVWHRKRGGERGNLLADI